MRLIITRPINGHITLCSVCLCLQYACFNMPLIIGTVMCSSITPIIMKHSLCAGGVCVLSNKLMCCCHGVYALCNSRFHTSSVLVLLCHPKKPGKVLRSVFFTEKYDIKYSTHLSYQKINQMYQPALGLLCSKLNQICLNNSRAMFLSEK